MSVQSVGNEPQVQKKSNLGSALGGAVALGTVGAAAGAGVSYFKTPSLEELLKKENPDTFTREAVTKADSEAAAKLDEANKAYMEACADEKNTLRAKQQEMRRAVDAQTVENEAELKKAINDKKQAFLNKEVEIEGKKYKAADVTTEVKNAKADIAALAEDATDEVKTAKKEALDKALNLEKKFTEATQEEREAIGTARQNLRKARKEKFEAEAAKDGDNAAKKLTNELADAKTKFTEAKSEKLGELVTDDLKGEMKKVSKAFREINWKSVGIWGGVAAAAGLILGLVMGGKKAPEQVAEVAPEPQQPQQPQQPQA